MPSGKQLVQQVLDRLPDDCSLEDIHYHIYVWSQGIPVGREIKEKEDLNRGAGFVQRPHLYTTPQIGSVDWNWNGSSLADMGLGD